MQHCERPARTSKLLTESQRIQVSRRAELLGLLGQLAVTTQALSNATIGDLYCCGNLFASGGVPGYTWLVASGELPAGLELPKHENTISGTDHGRDVHAHRAGDGRQGHDRQAFTITVS